MRSNADTDRARLERFLGEFPDNATCWSQATDELPAMYRWISDDGKRFPVVGRDNCKTPAEWNQKYKAAIREGYDKLDHRLVREFEERFVEWLKPRCICVGSESYCTHEGRCEKPVARSVSDGYCSRCLANALAESGE